MVFKEKIVGLLVKFTGLKKDEVSALLEIPPDESLGDYAFPCFVLAKKLKKAPAAIASDFAESIKKPTFVERVEANGPYVNFFIHLPALAENVLDTIFKEKKRYGQSKQKKETVMVEFFHANTHKGVHIGHLRNISLGSALARVLEAVGKKVIRVNYQGDIGPHVAKCLWGYQHFKKKAPAAHKGVWLGGVYADASAAVKKSKKFEKEVQELNKQIYARDKSIIDLWKKTRKWCLDDFDEFYKDFGVSFDKLYFESEAEPNGMVAMKNLLKKGIAEESDGAIIVDMTEDGLGVYVGITQFGTATYQAKDLGLAQLKLKDFTFDKSVHVVGSEQELYFKQIFKTFELMKSPLARNSYHLSYGLVMLPEGKMSSREGTMILYSNLFSKLVSLAMKEIKSRHKGLSAKDVEERSRAIAFAALKFGMIARESQKSIVFDWEKALDFEGDTGPYLQYAHARCSSILRKAGKKVSSKVHFESLSTVHEKKVLSALAGFGDVVADAADHYRPHVVAFYLLELAQAFNEFYHACPVISDVDEVMKARLLLVSSVKQVLENGLSLLGIVALEEM
jgi:arginyl-tRNA synthetase